GFAPFTHWTSPPTPKPGGAEPCPTRCASDRTCTPLGLLCDSATSSCVRCVMSSDCGSGQSCQAGACVSGRSRGARGGGGAGAGGAGGGGVRGREGRRGEWRGRQRRRMGRRGG